MKINKLLKKYRIRKYKTLGLRRVAKDVGMNYSYLFRVETGVHMPSDNFINKLSKKYDLDNKERVELFFLSRSKEMREIILLIKNNPNLIK